MPYGKIKCDTLVYDNNGTDAERSLISIVSGSAPLIDPTFTGTVTVPTPAADDNTTKAASTAYVQTELLDFAPLANATLTGTPAAPTAATGTSTTQIATTAFVQTESTLAAVTEETTYAAANSAATVVVNSKYTTDTTSAAYTLTLPASPTTGQYVVLSDQTGQWATNNLTVGRNSNNIAGQAADLVCNVANAHITLIWSGNATTGWIVK